jgi:transcriptional regulator with XRE-family HTH domain
MASKGRPSSTELAPFGRNLRAAIERSEDFANRSDFCAKAKIQPAQLYRYETGEQAPRMSDVKRWAAMLGVSAVDLDPELAGDARIELDDDPMRDESFLGFLETERGQATTQEERETLAWITRRMGRARSTETYMGLLSMIRTGFSREDAARIEAKHQEAREDAKSRGRILTSAGEKLRRKRSKD